jgi:hypothetical protein
MMDSLPGLWEAFSSWPLRFKILAFAVAVVLADFGLRLGAPRSRIYAGWKAGIEALGSFWTAIILSIVYFLSVSVVRGVLAVMGQDPLDRTLASEPSFWRPHEPNPLGVQAAARHQF